MASILDLPSAKTRRLIIISMLSLAGVLFAIAVFISVNNPSNVDLPVAIQSVSPERASNVLSQSDVTVDLAIGYTAELEINGVNIPEDQLFRVEALNQVSYQPDFGKVVERLRADENCVRVIYWLIASGPDTSATYTWCFDAS